MSDLQGLCMKCRNEENKPTMQNMKNLRVEQKKNRFSVKGQCEKCDGNMFKFLGQEAADKLKSEGAEFVVVE